MTVKWFNKLTCPGLFAIDPTLHWANPANMPMDPPKPWPPFTPGFPAAQKHVPIVTHLHGGEVQSIYDGHPDAWFTSNGKKGPNFVTSLYKAMSGGETQCGEKLVLPEGKYEIPMVIQDRSFNSDGSLAFPNKGINPDIHPYWNPEFFGDTIMVNGKVWPNLDVERTQYRFRLLNGSNARFYNLKFSNGMTFTQIGTDGGLLPKPVLLKSLLIAPAERADILVDFSGIAPGTKIILQNDANAPFPDGDAPDPDTTGQIMRFTVPSNACKPVVPHPLPDILNVIPDLLPDSAHRTLTLNEVQGPNGPVTVLLNGQKWSAPISELPKAGSTEEWTIVNLTMDTHPIHLHLVQFQVKNRQLINAEAYLADWTALNGAPPLDHPAKELPVEPYLDPFGLIEPDENEKGWKDTLRMNPGQVTRIVIRFAPQDIPVSVSKPGLNLYSFNPAVGPGYVWHCHILDHEDNEMMRPYKVTF